MHKLPSDSSTAWRSLESRWDLFFYAVLASLLLFLPVSLGVVEAWSEMVVSALAALLVMGLTLRVWLEPGFRVVRTLAYLPLMAIVLLIIVQLVPLPQTVVRGVSDNSIALRENLRVGESASPEESIATVSLYPFETSHDLRMALVFIAVFVTVASVFQSKKQIKLALWGVFMLGCLEAAVAVLQILTLTQRIHWMYVERGSVVTSGSFVNYSHFCQFMNLALGAGVAYVLVQIKEDSHRDRGRVSRLVDLRGDRYLRPLTGVVLCAVVVFTSMSRNGVLSLLIASGIIAVALYRRRVLSVRGWLLAIVPWAVVMLVFLTSFDVIYERFAALKEQQRFAGRLEMTTGALQAWRDFPVLGTGLGTHEYVFPLYDTATSPRMAEHADNDWAQLLEEFGLVGALSVICFVLSIFGVAVRLMLKGKTSLSTAAFGLTLGLLATAWHSLSDFGQHLPGVFVLTAVISGLLVALARYERRKTLSPERLVEGSYSPLAWTRSMAFAVPVSLLTLTGCWWGLSGAFRSYQAEAWSNTALGMEQRLESDSWLGSDQDYVDLLIAAEHASAFEPTNVKRGYLLNLYRWRSISRQRDPDSGDIIMEDGTVAFVSRLVEEFSALRKICPVYGPIHGLEGELRLFVLDEEVGKQLISNAARLTPFHAATNLVAGQLAAGEGRWDDAEFYFRRTIALDPRRFTTIARLCVNEFDRPELGIGLAGDEYRLIDQLAKIFMNTEPPLVGLADQLQGRAISALRALEASGEATPSEIVALARVELSHSRPARSIKLLRQALSRDYGNVDWRLLLAQTLLDEGELDHALREARIVIRRDPGAKAAPKLIQAIQEKMRE